MSYASCPNCGLTVRLDATCLLAENCPRCAARRQVVPMLISQYRRFSASTASNEPYVSASVTSAMTPPYRPRGLRTVSALHRGDE